jgi:hypothetical protein
VHDSNLRFFAGVWFIVLGMMFGLFWWPSFLSDRAQRACET